MRLRTVVGAAVLGAVAYAAWRAASRPGTAAYDFVSTVRTASAAREAELREAVTTMEDAAHAHPYSDASSARGEGRQPGRHAAPARETGRSLSREEAKAVLLDPTGRAGGASPEGQLRDPS